VRVYAFMYTHLPDHGMQTIREVMSE